DPAAADPSANVSMHSRFVQLVAVSEHLADVDLRDESESHDRMSTSVPRLLRPVVHPSSDGCSYRARALIRIVVLPEPQDEPAGVREGLVCGRVADPVRLDLATPEFGVGLRPRP